MTNKNVTTYVPDGLEKEKAWARTTQLCIAAHQDDVELMAYSGIGACYGKRNEWFSAVVTANGAGSPRSGIYADYTDEEMMRVRTVEQQKAAYVGDYGALVQLGYTSAQIKDAKNTDIVSDYAEILRMAKPKVVYTHNPADKHETHLGVCTKTIAAIRSLKKDDRPERLLGCEVWRGLDWVCDEEKVVLDTSLHPNIAAAVVSVFDSQILGGKRYDLAAEGRRRANATYFASHSTDATDSMNIAIDLTPLIKDDKLNVKEFIFAYIDRFKTAVSTALNKVL